MDKGDLKLKDKFFRWLCFNAVDMVGHKRRNFLQISKKIVLFFSAKIEHDREKHINSFEEIYGIPNKR